jgi:hypothetical protein
MSAACYPTQRTSRNVGVCTQQHTQPHAAGQRRLAGCCTAGCTAAGGQEEPAQRGVSFAVHCCCHGSGSSMPPRGACYVPSSSAVQVWWGRSGAIIICTGGHECRCAVMITTPPPSLLPGHKPRGWAGAPVPAAKHEILMHLHAAVARLQCQAHAGFKAARTQLEPKHMSAAYCPAHHPPARLNRCKALLLLLLQSLPHPC